MASFIDKGESIFIPFRNERSISDSQMKPRMYKTVQAFEKSFPKHYLGTDGVELVEYVPVKHGRWEWREDYRNYAKIFRCSACKSEIEMSHYTRGCEYDFCPNCGAKMEE